MFVIGTLAGTGAAKELAHDDAMNRYQDKALNEVQRDCES
jgi:hypothetical protein